MTDADREQFWRDAVIAFKHPRYDGVPFIEALRDLRRRRGEWV